MRNRYFLLLLCALVALVGCRTQAPRTEFAGHLGTLVSYNKVVSERHGTVGYVKVFEYTAEGKGDSFSLYHVYDLNFRERGILTPMGTGTKFVDLPTEIALAKGKKREEIALVAQPITLNVADCLDLDLNMKLKIVPARPEDVAPPKAE